MANLHSRKSLVRFLAALSIPLVAALVQYACWASIKPYIWFLFYPSVFFSSWVDGKRGGLVATLISCSLAVYVFEPPQFSWYCTNQRVWLSVSAFAVMGVFFSLFHEQLRKANLRAAGALDQAREANNLLEQRVTERTSELEHTTVTLRLSEERMGGIVSSAMDAIMSVDQAQHILLFNPAAERMFRCSAAEVLGQHLDRFIPQRFRPGHGQHIRTFDQTGVSARSMQSLGVLHALRADGTEFPIEASISQIEVNGQKLFTVILRDITERLRAESELSESRALLQAVIDGSREPIYYKDRRCRILVANPATLRVIGKPASEVIGRSDDQIYDDVRTGRTIVETDSRIMESGHGETLEESIFTEAGEHVFISTKTPHLDASGKVIGLVGVSVDITERKKAERSLAEREARFRSTLDGMFEGCQIISFDWRYIYVNTTAARYGHVEADQLIGRTVPECYPGIVGTPMHEALRRGLELRENSRHEYEFAYADGSKAVFEMAIQPVPEGIFIISLDITEQRKLEFQLRHAQKMDAIGTLAGGIAHDFNNILSAIMGFSQLIRMRAKADAETLECVDDILKASHRATSLVRQILTFSRQQKLERGSTQLGKVVSESLKLLRATIPTGIEFRLQLDQETSPVLADESQIHQVVMNLGVNAWHAMRSNQTGVLEVGLCNVLVDTDYAATQPELHPGPYVRLSVSDTGTGMERATLERVFEPFFTTKAPGEGTGLGLSVVHGIMRSHEGAITVYSTPVQGTVFHLYFPALNDGSGTLPEQQEQLPQGSGERILFVDDEAALVKMGTAMLGRLGYKVTAFSSAVEALAALRETPAAFDLVLSDQNMPHMTGVDFIRQMRTEGLQLPALLCTGYAGDLNLEKLAPLGVVALLHKPMLVDVLARSLQQALRPR